MDISTCAQALGDNWKSVLTIAYYSHLVPIALGLFMSGYALFKARGSKLALAFFLFTLSFCVWLAGDLAAWVVQNYFIVYFSWSWLDFANVIFFVLGAYFFALLARDTITKKEALLYLLLVAPAFYITVTGNSVGEFNQPVCEAINSNFLTQYKLFAEVAVVAFMLLSYVIAWRKSDKSKKIRTTVILLATLLFFAVFAGADYVASLTGVYEISLYSLFVLPLFLMIMMFAITNLDMFGFRLLGTQILSYGLVITAGSQFLFIQNFADSIITTVTVAFSVVFALLLLQNAHKEIRARQEIERLADQLEVANTRLKELDRQKTEFVSIASHQLRSPLTAIKGYASLLLEDSFGKLSKGASEAIGKIFTSSQYMAVSIEDFLNVSRIELGTIKYDLKDFDLAKMVNDVVEELVPTAKGKGLTLTFESHCGVPCLVKGDIGKLRQVVLNLVDNAMKYTPKGSITVYVRTNAVQKQARIEIVDTGVGIPEKVMPTLFGKFIRAANANEVNVMGTGLGLYVAKQFVEAHGGRIWAESKGQNMGSTFIVEFPLLSAPSVARK